MHVCPSAWAPEEQDSSIAADLSLNSIFSAGMFTNSWGQQGFCPAGPVISSTTARSQSCSANGRQITEPIASYNHKELIITQWRNFLLLLQICWKQCASASVHTKCSYQSLPFSPFYYKHSFPSATETTSSRKHYFNIKSWVLVQWYCQSVITNYLFMYVKLGGRYCTAVLSPELQRSVRHPYLLTYCSCNNIHYIIHMK